MDVEHEIRRAKWLLFAAAIFLMSACFSWEELIYLLFGRNAEANVTKVFEVTRGGRFGRGGSPRVVVEFTFVEPNGTPRSGADEVLPDSPIQAQTKPEPLE